MILFKLLLTIVLILIPINYFMMFVNSLSVSGMNATGTRTNSHKFFIDLNMNQHEVWDPSEIINTQWCLNLSFILFFLVMYLNHRLYSRRSIKSCRIIITRYSISIRTLAQRAVCVYIQLKIFVLYGRSIWISCCYYLCL